MSGTCVAAAGGLFLVYDGAAGARRSRRCAADGGRSARDRRRARPPALAARSRPGLVRPAPCSPARRSGRLPRLIAALRRRPCLRPRRRCLAAPGRRRACARAARPCAWHGRSGSRRQSAIRPGICTMPAVPAARVGLRCPPSRSHLSPSRPGSRRAGARDRGVARARRGRGWPCATIPAVSTAAPPAAEPLRRAVRRAHRAEQLAVVDESGHALRGQRAGERVRVDREVRQRVPADRAQRPGRVAGDHLDVAVEQHPVARLRLVAVAQRVPALVGLGVLHDRDDLRRGRVGVDPDVGPLVQRPRIGRPPGDPALLAGGLGAQLQRQAGERGAGLAVVRAVHAVAAAR